MNLVIPPLFFYVVGAMLVIFGAARASWLGVRRASREIERDVGPDDEAGAGQTAAAAAAKARRRHLIFGVVWILMGIFLIVSTAGVLKVRFPS
jgi:hypothetical protein